MIFQRQWWNSFFSYHLESNKNGKTLYFVVVTVNVALLLAKHPRCVIVHACAYTGLFISPSGISKIDCATIKTDTRQKEAYQWIENLSKFLSNLTAARYVHPW